MGKLCDEYRDILISLEDDHLYSARDIVKHAERMGLLGDDPEMLAVRRKNTYNALTHHRKRLADPKRNQNRNAEGGKPRTRDYEYWAFRPESFKNEVSRGGLGGGRHLTPCWYGALWKYLLDPQFPENHEAAPAVEPVVEAQADPTPPPSVPQGKIRRPWFSARSRLMHRLASLAVALLGALVLLQWNRRVVFEPSIQKGQAVALITCPGDQGEERMINQMLKRGFHDMAHFRVIPVGEMARELDVAACGSEDPDPKTLQRLARFSGARFLLWGETTFDEDGYGWKGVLWEVHNGPRRMRLRGDTADALADQIIATCTGILGLAGPTKSTATGYSPDERANLFYSEGLAKLERNEILTAEHYFKTALQYDALFHLARVKQAVCLRHQAKYAEADTQLSSLLATYGPILDDQLLVEIYRNLVQVRLQTHHVNLDSTLLQGKIKAKASSPQDYMYFLKIEGFLARRKGSREQAAYHYNAAYQVAERASDPETQIEARILKAHTASDTGDHEQALVYLGEALTLAREFKMVSKEIGLICEIAGVRNDLHEWQTSLNDLESVLPEARNSGDPMDLLRVKFWLAYCNEQLGEYENVKETYIWVIAECKTLGNVEFELVSEVTLINFLIKTGMLAEAENRLSSFGARPLNDVPEYAIWYFERKSFLLYRLQSFGGSLSASDELVNLLRSAKGSLGSPFALGRALNNRAETKEKLGMGEEAIQDYLEAISFKMASRDPTLNSTRSLLIKLYKKLGQHDKARSLQDQNK